MKRIIENILFPKVKINQALLAEKLHKKTIVITGGSFGIGEQLCRQLSEINCHLIIVARTKEKLQQIQQELQNKPAAIHIFSADLSDEVQLNQFIQYLQQYSVDIVINNAGKSICRPIMQSLDCFHDFQRTMQLNYFVPVKLCLALIPQLEKNKGHVINISAVNVLLAPTAYWAAYQASKTAFDQWLRCAEAELLIKGIKVSTAYLPLVKTRMIEPTAAYQHAPTMSRQQAADHICQLIIQQRAYYKPWWTLLGQISSVFFARTWVNLMQFYLKKKKC
ncbi:Short-chain dehydrogenase (YqjQ) [Commensalibacter communis]|uniref:SDR family NAD(P)-dependent oxidoreductase n=1 Tax=Commensalibacter communis TaxID=2972786 RepID=UPI0022FF7D65|nr:SDR family NAD(P)-dependent oxidoreductase [Commensalibacter communis]CAI3924676.1 Short-chain dehydrogenase (YqjQ) [Commensalibacter communis]CAI3934468.1 Short-chain dehydrogenase (YqjQ) [Commensalibacter communis]